MKITKQLCKNFTKGRDGQKPDLIVHHITDDLDVNRVLTTFNNSKEEKSSHYLVLRNGEVIQLVEESDVAWTNGLVKNPTNILVKSRPKVNPNKYSLTIEVMALANTPLTDFQYESIAELDKGMCERWKIPSTRTNLCGHNEIRSDKSCPAMTDLERVVISVNRLQEPREEMKPKMTLLQELVAKIKLLLELLKQQSGLLGSAGFDSCEGGLNN